MSDLFFDATKEMEVIERDLWQELAKSLSKSSHPFRYPTLATFGKDYPQQRTLVLRKSIARQKLLHFYTDRKSDKIAELQEHRQVGLHFYHPRKKLQLRLNGLIAFADEAKRKAAFEEIPQSRHFEYSAKPEPGTPISRPDFDYQFETEEASDRFQLLIFDCQQAELLQLNGQHHYRLELKYDDEKNYQAQWLMP